jgi:hypothetical protein
MLIVAFSGRSALIDAVPCLRYTLLCQSYARLRFRLNPLTFADRTLPVLSF